MQTTAKPNWFYTSFTASKPVANLLFYRPNMFYVDTYLVFTGTQSALQSALEREQARINLRQATDNRGDHDNFEDSPADTFCDGTCAPNTCAPDGPACASHWQVSAYCSESDMNAALAKLPVSYYGNIQVVPFH